MRIKLEQQNIYFISDLHLFHKNVINFDNRPFKSVQDMNDSLVKNWNDKITDDAIIFYMGDLSFQSFNKTKEVISELKGKKYFIIGNHDNYSDIKKMDKFIDIYDYVDLYVKDETPIDNLGTQQLLCLSHYAILQWNRKHHNSFHLHGHSHQQLSKNPDYDWYYKGLVLDVSCNGINYTPISYNEVKQLMLSKIIF